MPSVERSSRAESDAVHIWLHIAEDDPVAASRLLKKIDEQIESLARMPESAEAVPEIAKGLRRSSVGNYIIYYRPVTDGIQVSEFCTEQGNRKTCCKFKVGRGDRQATQHAGLVHEVSEGTAGPDGQ